MGRGHRAAHAAGVVARSLHRRPGASARPRLGRVARPLPGFTRPTGRRAHMSDVELAVVIPSRGRPHAITDLWAAWQNTTAGLAQLVVCLDLDDDTKGDYPSGP